MLHVTTEEMVSLIDKGGVVEKNIPSFEVREGQKQMLRDVATAFLDHKTALLEAETGTGKSVAYLIPVLFEALQEQQTTVISTHTISLQQQLIEKDIPHLLQALNIDTEVCLVKGMQNYLCARRLEEAIEEAQDDKPTLKPLEEIAAEVETSEEGSFSDFQTPIEKKTWEKVKAQKENCTFVKCPHFKSCFFFKARKKCEKARVLVVNHHLLFADLAARNTPDDPCILPPYRKIVIDEAHHIEKVATEYFSNRASRFAFQLLLGRLIADKKRGKLMAFASKLNEEQHSALIETITFDLAVEKQALLEVALHLFDAFATLPQQAKEERLLLNETHAKAPLWKEEIYPLTKELSGKTKAFVASVLGLEKEIKDPKTEQHCEGVLAEIRGILGQLQSQVEMLNDFVFKPFEEEKVRWIERSERNVAVVEAKLSVKEELKERLFNKFDAVVLASATLQTHCGFSFIQEKLGIDNAPITSSYPSPFDYTTQAKLFCPLDLPSPTHASFVHEAASLIAKLLQKSGGDAFVLFTSYSMLTQVRRLIEPLLKKEKIPLFSQGEKPRAKLLEAFKNKKRSVLLATDSFWEGVDVVGEKLRLVVIVKLPFKVPTEPLLKARALKLQNEGKSPFFEEALPEAVIKFKQGFGRLIRNRTDRGAVVCLDARLAKKGYGNHFLKRLPPCPKLFDTQEVLLKELEAFFRGS